MVESTTATVVSDFFVVPEDAKTVANLHEKEEEGRYWLEISAKKKVSHDVI